MRVGIDLMGSDCSPFVLLSAIRSLCQKFCPKVSFEVFATEDLAKEVAAIQGATVNIVTEVITMDDDPVFSVHEKKGSSLVKGMQMLAEKHVDAFVSAGNTGALMVAAKLHLPMIGEMRRPALLASLPTMKGNATVLDVGANLSCRAENLVQYAKMGIAYKKHIHNVIKPTVALLNVGIESRKGTYEHKRAFALLRDLEKSGSEGGDFSFVGNIEGREVFRGGADVIVADGFSGNVFLKTAEGTAEYLFDQLEHFFEGNNFYGELKTFRERFHYSEHPGAVLSGVQGVVVKCHGDATEKSLFNGVVGAIDLIEKNFLQHLAACV